MGVFVWGFSPVLFCLEGFVRGAFCLPQLLSEYIHYNRKLNITFNLYENILSVTSHALGHLLPLSKTITPSRTRRRAISKISCVVM